MTVGWSSTNSEIGRAAAMTVIFFVIVLAITIVQRRVAREEREVA